MGEPHPSPAGPMQPHVAIPHITLRLLKMSDSYLAAIATRTAAIPRDPPRCRMATLTTVCTSVPAGGANQVLKEMPKDPFRHAAGPLPGVAHRRDAVDAFR